MIKITTKTKSGNLRRICISIGQFRVIFIYLPWFFR